MNNPIVKGIPEDAIATFRSWHLKSFGSSDSTLTTRIISKVSPGRHVPVWCFHAAGVFTFPAPVRMVIFVVSDRNHDGNASGHWLDHIEPAIPDMSCSFGIGYVAKVVDTCQVCFPSHHGDQPVPTNTPATVGTTLVTVNDVRKWIGMLATLRCCPERVLLRPDQDIIALAKANFVLVQGIGLQVVDSNRMQQPRRIEVASLGNISRRLTQIISRISVHTSFDGPIPRIAVGGAHKDNWDCT
mmetsp:Transcript_74194/g.214967  ORF Transcript_74194/g.214967 Transcript_74194/m.214967 type:complete len:242 (-) Transcript_74194:638-1363(-)